MEVEKFSSRNINVGDKTTFITTGRNQNNDLVTAVTKTIIMFSHRLSLKMEIAVADFNNDGYKDFFIYWIR